MNKKNEGVKIMKGVVMFSSQEEKTSIMDGLRTLCENGAFKDHQYPAGLRFLPAFEVGPEVRGLNQFESYWQWKLSTKEVTGFWKRKIHALLPDAGIIETNIVGSWLISYDFLAESRDVDRFYGLKHDKELTPEIKVRLEALRILGT